MKEILMARGGITPTHPPVQLQGPPSIRVSKKSKPSAQKELLCEVCDEPFRVYVHRRVQRRARFCSWSCRKKGLLSTRNKLTLADVCAIREQYIPRKNSCHKIALTWKVTPQSIWRIVSFRAWA